MNFLSLSLAVFQVASAALEGLLACLPEQASGSALVAGKSISIAGLDLFGSLFCF